MIESKEREELRLKANMYKLLSALYGQPTEEFSDLLWHLKEPLTGLLQPELLLVFEEMEKDLPPYKEDLTDLKIHHAKLFIGPFDVLAAPYSSVYLDGDRRVMGESTMIALDHYRQAGLTASLDFKEPPDHIVAELEFVYYVIASYLNSGDSHWMELKSSFLNRHLGLWISSFTVTLGERSSSGFYRNLARITEKFLQRELREEAVIA